MWENILFVKAIRFYAHAYISASFGEFLDSISLLILLSIVAIASSLSLDPSERPSVQQMIESVDEISATSLIAIVKKVFPKYHFITPSMHIVVPRVVIYFIILVEPSRRLSSIVSARPPLLLLLRLRMLGARAAAQGGPDTGSHGTIHRSGQGEGPGPPLQIRWAPYHLAR